MIEIGKYNELRILSKTEAGLNLTDGDKLVILPYQYVPNGVEIGDNIKVFVFVQKDGRLTGTTQKAYAEVGDFAFLKVVSDGDDGVFMDLGIDKDVYVPDREQKRPMQKGYKYVVYLYLDESNDRLLASSKLYDFVEEDGFDFEEGDEVSLLITEETDLGYNAIINNTYIGLLYNNEVFDNIQPGEMRKGWIKKIRVEGKIDLTLQPSGYGHILDSKEMMLKELKKSGGVIELGDKSSPEDIYHRFQISKSAFKKTIGSLYKERLIVLSDDSIRLIADDEAE
jgi:predicted RNA-binding protein (virulence factor B family)